MGYNIPDETDEDFPNFVKPFFEILKEHKPYGYEHLSCLTCKYEDDHGDL